MPGITQYLFETTLCLAIFWGFYQYFLRKNIRSKWNRWYLLSAPILSIIIPGLDLIYFFQDFFYAVDLDGKLLSQSENLNLAIADKLEEKAPPFQFKINDLLKSVYLIGVAVLGFRFIDKYWKWVNIFQKNKPDWYVGYTLDNPYLRFPNSSLFSFLFWNKKLLPESMKNQLSARRFKLNWTNSLDVILMNGMTIGMWFHPLIYPFKDALHEWHEVNLTSNLNLNNELENIPNQPFEWRKSFHNALLSLIPLTILIIFFSTNITEQSTVYQKIMSGLEDLDNHSNFVLFKYEKEKPANYHLEWGDLKLPLENVAAPNGYSGEIELELNEFQMILDSTVSVFKDSEKQKFKILDIEMERAENRRTFWFPNQDPDSIKLAYRWQRDKIIELKKGDELSLSGKVGDIFLAGVKIKISDPFEMYEPEFSPPPIDQTEANFEFQVVNLPNQKSIIRIDTSNEKTAHILDLYRDPDKHQINHIPNFKTNKRLIATENILYPNVDDEVMIEEPIFNVYELPEFQDYQNKLVRLFMGKMIAAPNSKNYTKDQFLKNYKKDVRLKVSNEYLDLVSFRMLIVSKEEHPKSFLLSPHKMEAIHYDFRQVKPETSIYFENIVVLYKDELMHFPISFMFNIGKDQDEYELAISESQHGTPKDARRDVGYIYYQNYSISELMGVLTGDERLVFEAGFEEPRLDVLFQSPHLPTSKGEQLILDKLREQFNYQTDLKFDSRKVWVIQPPENQEYLESFEYFYRIRPNLERLLEFNKSKGLETITPGFFDDLAHLIEERFGVYVFNESGLEKAYGLGLDLSSFEALKKQLKKDYGIELLEEKRTIRTRKVRG